MKNQTITVTLKNIQDGQKGQRDSCPIALALKEAGFTSVSVGIDHATFTEGIERHCVALGAIHQRFIARFDGGLSVQPVSLYLS